MSFGKVRPADKHKGYYGNEPVKAGQDPELRAAAATMQLPTRKPCAECPLRKDSLPGFLGGYTPEMYLEIMSSPAMIACHSSPGFHEGDVPSMRMCTGVAAFRANTGQIASVVVDGRAGRQVVTTTAHEATKFIGSDTEHYFATEEEFVEHHTPGQKPVHR